MLMCCTSNAKNIYALEERNATFQKDPDVRKFDAERILCGMCDKYVFFYGFSLVRTILGFILRFLSPFD